MRRLVAVLTISGLLAATACSGGGREVEDEPGEEIATQASALVASDPVSSAVRASCSTTAVKGLATQLVDEIDCLKPGALKRIDGVAGLKLGSAVFPYLQSAAATALASAQKSRGATMSINSGLRALPQQFLLYRWYVTGRCGIGLAARPGRSNHESGVAVDINDDAGWRSAMASKGFRWLGASDPVHFDFTGGGTVEMGGLSVKAFQRLWNRNHPEDPIVEDGAFGAETEKRLEKSPVGGFATGAICDATPAKPAPPDARPEPSPPDPAEPAATEPAPLPDATEPADLPAPSGDEAKTTRSAPLDVPAVGVGEAGCAAAPGGAGGHGAVLLFWIVAGLALGGRSRLRRIGCDP